MVSHLLLDCALESVVTVVEAVAVGRQTNAAVRLNQRQRAVVLAASHLQQDLENTSL